MERIEDRSRWLAANKKMVSQIRKGELGEIVLLLLYGKVKRKPPKEA